MWIKGGNAVWGNSTHAPDDDVNATHTHGELVSFRQALEGSDISKKDGFSAGNMTTEDAITWTLQHTPSTFQVRFSDHQEQH
jgi:phospholipid:diacylglycerol acyltransferase